MYPGATETFSLKSDPFPYFPDGNISYEAFKRLMTRNQPVVMEYIQEKTSLGTLQSWVATKTAKKSKPRRKFAGGLRSNINCWPK